MGVQELATHSSASLLFIVLKQFNSFLPLFKKKKRHGGAGELAQWVQYNAKAGVRIPGMLAWQPCLDGRVSTRFTERGSFSIAGEGQLKKTPP